jgi:hypothetical protein
MRDRRLVLQMAMHLVWMMEYTMVDQMAGPTARMRAQHSETTWAQRSGGRWESHSVLHLEHSTVDQWGKSWARHSETHSAHHWDVQMAYH